MKTVKAKGRLRYDQNEGWMLLDELGRDSIRVADLFHDLEWKNLTITIKAVDSKEDPE